MSVLRSLESKIADLVEGTFSRAFRSEVRPVEIARKLAREMEEHKQLSLSRAYAPNEYRVFLSPRDRERFAGYESALADELPATCSSTRATSGSRFAARPVIDVRDRRAPRVGRVRDPDQGAELAGEGARGTRPGCRTHDDLLDGRAPGRATRGASPGAGGSTALLLLDGKRMVVGAAGVTLGRSRQCDVVLEDANVSRRHAEIRPRGGSWVLTDLGLDERRRGSMAERSTRLVGDQVRR